MHNFGFLEGMPTQWTNPTRAEFWNFVFEPPSKKIFKSPLTLAEPWPPFGAIGAPRDNYDQLTVATLDATMETYYAASEL